MKYKYRRGINSILIIIFWLTSHSFAKAQTFNREQIIGVWTSREVIFTKPYGETPSENATIEKTKRALVNSQFVFQHNGIFLLRLPGSAPTEFRELEQMNNKMWHIKSKEQMVFVGSLDEDLMTINIKFTNGFYYFSIKDTPLVLKMVKGR